MKRPLLLLPLLFLLLTASAQASVKSYGVKSNSCGYVHQPNGSYIETGDIWAGDPVLQCPKRGWIDFEYDGFFAKNDYKIEKVELVLNVKDAASSSSSFVFTSYQSSVYDLDNPLDAGDMTLTGYNITAHDLWDIIAASSKTAVANAGMPLGEVRIELGMYYFLNYDRGTIPIGIYEDGDNNDEVIYWGTGELAPRLEVTYSEVPSFYVYQPKSSSTVSMGSNVLIKWTSDSQAVGFPTKVALYKGGSQVSVITSSTTATQASWYPGYDLPEGDDYQIVISNFYHTTKSPFFSVKAPRPECAVLSVSCDHITITRDFTYGFINVTSEGGCDYWDAETDVSGLTLDLQQRSVGRLTCIFDGQDWTPRQGVIRIGDQTVDVYVNMSPPSAQTTSAALQPVYELLLHGDSGTDNDPGTDDDAWLTTTEGMFVVYGATKTFTTTEVASGEQLKAKYWTKLYVAPLNSSVSPSITVSNYATVLIVSTQTQTPGSSVTHRYDYIGTPSIPIDSIQASSNLEGGYTQFLNAVSAPGDSLMATAQSIMLKTYGEPTLKIIAVEQSR